MTIEELATAFNKKGITCMVKGRVIYFAKEMNLPLSIQEKSDNFFTLKLNSQTESISSGNDNQMLFLVEEYLNKQRNYDEDNGSSRSEKSTNR